MFVEIRHVETGSMSQVIQGNNLRCLCTDVEAILASDDRVLTLRMAVLPGQ